MRINLLKICRLLGIPPGIWMVQNPIKIYEYLVVTGFSNLEKHESILDLGCGPGIWTFALARRCRKTIGIDISKGAIQMAQRYIRNSTLKNRLEFCVGRLEEAGISEASLDHVFSFCVLEHIDNLGDVLVEVKRILRPGGYLHVSVDSLATIGDPMLKTKHQHDHFVVQYFTEKSLRELLQSAGFKVHNIRSILTGEIARREFEKRILQDSYRYPLMPRAFLVKRFRDEDLQTDHQKGIMVVAHASRP